MKKEHTHLEATASTQIIQNKILIRIQKGLILVFLLSLRNRNSL